MAMARILCKTSWIIEIWDYYFDCPINFCQRFHHLANVSDEREWNCQFLPPYWYWRMILSCTQLWPVKCPWSRPDRPAALIRPGPSSETRGCAAVNCVQSSVPGSPVPAFLTSGQWPAVRDLPGSRDRGRCLEQELQFCSCRWQACSYQSMGRESEESFF